jgi:hypothetical protein
MKPHTASVSMKSFALGALVCALVLCAAPAAYAQGGPPASSNPYAVAGEQFLLQVQHAFIQTKLPKNFNLPLYASDINPLTGTQLTGNAALFAQENLIRAFYWGAQVFPAQFTPILSNSVDQLAWNEYLSAHGECFGTTANATCFFDDDAQLGGTLMDIYLHVLPTAEVYNDSKTALHYVLSNTDAQGGIPQVPANLGQGNFYMNPVVESGQTDVNYGTIFNNSGDVTVGLNYFNEVNNPALGLINKNGLFIGGTTYEGNGQWLPNNVGPLAGESVNVSLLALSLYRNTGNVQYLHYAENLTNLVATKWIASNGGVSQDAVNGGYAVVNLLCQVYMMDRNVTYFNDAQNIINFLLNNNRDTAGYFANGTNGATSDWNQVRTGQPPAADTTLLTQSAAAAAILEFAYVDINYPPTPGSVELLTSVVVTATSTGYSETVTVTNKGTAVAPSVLITLATLGSAAGSTLPALLGDLRSNQSASVTLTFPASAGAANFSTIAHVAGSYSGGTFGGGLRTTLP